MVEIRIIPEGIRSEPAPGVYSRKRARNINPPIRETTDHLPSFEVKTKPVKTSEGNAPRHQDYHFKARGAVHRMQADNALENRRVRPRDVRKMLGRMLKTAYPTISEEELTTEVDRLLPKAMAEYRGPPILSPEDTPELKAIRKARRDERKRIVKANSARRQVEEYKRKASAKQRRAS